MRELQPAFALLEPFIYYFFITFQLCILSMYARDLFYFHFQLEQRESLGPVSSGSAFFLGRRFPQPALTSVTLCLSHAAPMIHLHIPTGYHQVSNSGPEAETHGAVAARLGPTSLSGHQGSGVPASW